MMSDVSIIMTHDRYMTLTHSCDTAWAQSADTETRDILTRDTGLTHVREKYHSFVEGKQHFYLVWIARGA